MPNTRIGTHWKKPPTKVYDYNYNLGEHYYKPQLRHAEQRCAGRSTTPPRARTFAERFVADPLYGSYGTPNWRSPAEGPRRGSFGSEDLYGARKPSGDRAAGPGERFRLGPSLSQDDSDFVRTPRLDDLNDFIKGKLAFLDAPSTPTAGRGASPGRRQPVEDPFDEPFFQQKREMKGSETRKPVRQFSPEFDMAAEEAAIKSSFKNRRLAQQQFDDDLDEPPRVESMASRFRAKLRAAQEETGDADEYESRISKIRSRARARMAEMEDDFEDMSFKPERQNRVGFADEAGAAGSKSLKITKRSVRTTYDED